MSYTEIIVLSLCFLILVLSLRMSYFLSKRKMSSVRDANEILKKNTALSQKISKSIDDVCKIKEEISELLNKITPSKLELEKSIETSQESVDDLKYLLQRAEKCLDMLEQVPLYNKKPPRSQTTKTFKDLMSEVMVD
ncbi:MAG: hypothetical protein P857_1063 [Candidatus Xenolissoclinum pacificiensis L6]|uniref:Uncharacterized protein n=1 Tax=Candidatus Xenolissoclinum pacificiensis L6 TaxID=1401685 RepID=W2V348_9RICK|nr:MAG: hypothetical protein P857_1063 [Candidatus Xenolissoclinum pacificiensis L6]